MDNQNTKTIEGGRMAMQEEKGREGEIEIIEMHKAKTHLDGKNRKCIAVSQLPSWLYEGSIRRTHIERMKRECVKEVRLKKFEPKEQRRWEVVADAA
ncbi:hypothetical protein BDDG_12735 [Blastomyces dermatitidis ATCC 18188]|uniref:Uncharacterized protein n=1 Tax=Ajellomyces dermatitidis (strain ATCC 18188 / CBS 674.68) TaxID=653446 RepID=A0A0J9EPV5_AJEDA|nr:hypothetical protein BDDG_12735 [Blastomyces dermatitidis ATCC 18188]